MSSKFKYKDSRERYPGPGQYLRFSEFGILVSKKARKAQEILREEYENEKKGKKEKNIKTESNAPMETTKMETIPENKNLQTE